MASPFTTRPEIVGTFGVVSSTHWVASQHGMAALERGGNAFDAAVTAGIVLHVVEPHMNGMGGDAVILVQEAGKAPKALCGQGPAPSGATIAHYKAEGLTIVPGTGLLAAVIPGAFDSWMLMLRDHGTITLRAALTPALELARDGYPVIAGVADAVAGVAELFRTEWTTSAPIWLPGGAPPKAGQLHRNPDLAATYARLIEEGEKAGKDRTKQIEAARAAYSKGFVAEAIERFCASTPTMDASGERHKGVLTAADMAGWQASWEAPVSLVYRGTTVYKAGPWSQGPVALQTLSLLEGYDLAAMATDGPQFVHTLVEAMKLAYADREAWYGDPEFVDVPMAALLDAGYAADRRGLIGAEASLELRPGAPGGRNPRLPEVTGPVAAAAGVGEPTRVETERVRGGAGLAGSKAARGPASGDTCHLDVIDRWGNVVAATPSGGWLQSSPTVPGLGFCLGSRAQMYWLEEGLPASLAPGRRPRTTLTPTLATREDGTTIAFGSPGGDNQDQWVLQFFLRHVEHGLNLQAAIDAPMLQSDHWPNSFYPRTAQPGALMLEGRFPEATVENLEARGHRVSVVDDWSLGRNCAARRDADGTLRAGATARRQQAYAVGR